MNVYLVKITNPLLDVLPRYKSGYTKWGKDNIVAERFYKHGDFEGLKVELLAVKYIQHDSWAKAKEMCIAMEKRIFTHIPKKARAEKDNIEEHFNIEPRPESFGCTEFHHLDINELYETDDDLAEHWCAVTGGKRV